MSHKEFRDELVKVLPGYKWTVHNGGYIKYIRRATGTISSGSNRLSTIVVERTVYAFVTYEATSYGYGTRSEALCSGMGKTLAQALRNLQEKHEALVNVHRSMVEQIESARQQKHAFENVEAVA